MARWAKNWDCCQQCGTTERKHNALGLCQSCYSKYHFKYRAKLIHCARCGRNDKHFAHGLCKKCYKWQYRQDHLEEMRAEGRKYEHEHKEDRAAYRCRYREEHLEELRAKGREYQRAHREERKDYLRQYYQEHKEERAEQWREWYKEHREEWKAKHRKYYQENIEACRAYSRQYRLEHLERERENKKRWQLENPEKYRERGRKYVRIRRARLNKVAIEPVDEAAIYERDNYQCVYCGSSEQLSLDHVIPISRDGPHCEDNLVVACKSCNSSKGAKLLIEWLEYLMLKEIT